jgi:GGDEF domain-containing protein
MMQPLPPNNLRFGSKTPPDNTNRPDPPRKKTIRFSQPVSKYYERERDIYIPPRTKKQLQTENNRLQAQLDKTKTSLVQKNNLLKKLTKESITDSLTGLYNRRFFEGDKKTQEKGMAQKLLGGSNKPQPPKNTKKPKPKYKNAPVSLLLCDLDKFKSINDTYKHWMGDFALQLVARIADDSRRTQSVGRRKDPVLYDGSHHRYKCSPHCTTAQPRYWPSL